MSLLPEPLRIADFRAYWLARLTTTIAQMAMVIVIGWQVYDIARETMSVGDAAFQLGLIGLVQFVPLFVLTLVTGWAADKVDRRWIARASVALALALALTVPATVAERDAIFVTAFVVVAFSILVQGLTMPPLTKHFGLVGRTTRPAPAA